MLNIAYNLGARAALEKMAAPPQGPQLSPAFQQMLDPYIANWGKAAVGDVGLGGRPLKTLMAEGLTREQAMQEMMRTSSTNMANLQPERLKSVQQLNRWHGTNPDSVRDMLGAGFSADASKAGDFYSYKALHDRKLKELSAAGFAEMPADAPAFRTPYRDAVGAHSDALLPSHEPYGKMRTAQDSAGLLERRATSGYYDSWSSPEEGARMRAARAKDTASIVEHKATQAKYQAQYDDLVAKVGPPPEPGDFGPPKAAPAPAPAPAQAAPTPKAAPTSAVDDVARAVPPSSGIKRLSAWMAKRKTPLALGAAGALGLGAYAASGD